MDDQHNGGGLPPDNTPHVVYPEDPESAYHPGIDPPLTPAVVAGGGTRTPPPPPPPDDEDDEDSGMLRMSFMEHLEELRSRIIKALIGFGVAFLACLLFAVQIWDYVQAPLKDATSKLGGEIIAIDPMEQFSIIWMWSPLVVSIFLAAPWVVYQVWAFIAPGLYPKERRWAVPFVVCTGGLFIAGGCFAYFLAFRYAMLFLLGIGAPTGVKAYISIDRYFSLFVNVMLGISLVFELPVIIFFLTLIRVASPSFLLKHSRYAILAIVLLAAIITPTPDVFNLTLFAVPMILLYFMGVFASYLLVMRRENRKFPWRIFSYWLLAVIAVLAICVVVAIGKYQYHFVPRWPFLMK